MAAKKKSGQTYIRMGPDVHTRIAKVAKALDMDINGLLNLSVRTLLPQYELLVQADQTGDPRKKASVLRFLHALTQFTSALMAQTEFIARGPVDLEGKAALEHLIDVMYEFAVTVGNLERSRTKNKPAPSAEEGKQPQPSRAEPSSEAESSSQSQEKE